MNALLRALIVDGNEDDRRTISRILAPNGVESVEARDGIEALSFASKYGVDLIVTALHLQRLDGRELISLVNRGAFGLNPPPVIAYADAASAHGSAGFSTEDCLAVLTKPVGAKDLLEAFRRAFL